MHTQAESLVSSTEDTAELDELNELMIHLVTTDSHLRQMLVVGEQAHKHIDNFSKDFMDEFVTHLSRRFVPIPPSFHPSPTDPSIERHYLLTPCPYL
jgi:hypothetical protein